MASSIQRVTAIKPSINPALPVDGAQRSVTAVVFVDDVQPEKAAIVFGKCASPPAVTTNNLTAKTPLYFLANGDQFASRQSGSGYQMNWTFVLDGGSGWAVDDDIYAAIVDGSASNPQTVLAFSGPYPVK